MTRVILMLLGLAVVLSTQCARSGTLTGLDRIDEYHHLFAGKRIGIIANQTSMNADGEHITDLFLNMDDVKVTALFGPEHGVRGQAADGVRVGDETQNANDIPVYSLYGRTKKPTPDMLSNVDVLIFDMQDVGARFYTYIWTMFYAMQAAAENGVQCVVLDRPNPIGGGVEGPMLDTEFASFIGLKPLPVRHGMTIGELAQLFNGEGWLGKDLRADLTVVPMINWQHDMWYDETGLDFIPPSPNMPNLETAAVYPGLCLIEGTNVSEGRGTDTPFLSIGAPWIDGEQLAQALADQRIAGVEFVAAEFTPRSIPGKALHPKYENKRCDGVTIRLTNRDFLQVFELGLRIIATIKKLYPDDFAFRADGHFDLLCGTDEIRLAINNGQSVEEIKKLWAQQLIEFRKLRKKYVLYPD